jgi:hypothetical protein
MDNQRADKETHQSSTKKLSPLAPTLGRVFFAPDEALMQPKGLEITLILLVIITNETQGVVGRSKFKSLFCTPSRDT